MNSSILWKHPCEDIDLITGIAVVPGPCRDSGPVSQIPMIGTGTQSHGTFGTGTNFRDERERDQKLRDCPVPSPPLLYYKYSCC